MASTAKRTVTQSDTKRYQKRLVCGFQGAVSEVNDKIKLNREGTTMTRFEGILPAALVGLGLSLLTANTASSAPYVQTDLVSDLSAVGATITDPSLVNPWGISHTATSPFWISNQGTGLTNLWSVTGQTNVTKMTAVNPPTGNITIPPGEAVGVGPTGQVANQNPSPSSFPVGNGGNGGSAHFIFANLNGTISAWDTGGTAFVQVTTPGANYSGLAINQAQTQLYAANQAGTGSVNVFNSSFAPVSLAPGAFATPPAVAALGLVPFNVQDINGKIYVEYAPSGLANQRGATGGMGAVAVFDESGNLLQTITGSQLAAPWGVALAPSGFGEFANDLLVGNFSFVDGDQINAFDPTNGVFEGMIPVNPGAGQTSGGLWALNFGIGGSNGDPNTLYITDGIDGETHGLFAAIDPVPEPSTLALLSAGLLSLCALRWRRSARPRGALLKGF
jgi:uncharacterized protein (TIGR03118 family)